MPLTRLAPALLVGYRNVPCTGDGSDEAATINAVITSCNAAGGGVAVLPIGLTIRASNIRMKDNTSLLIPRGTILKQTDSATTDLIQNDTVAAGNTNISLLGGGEIDGNAANAAGVKAPPTAPSGAQGAAGNVPVGSYDYMFTWKHASGESNPSPISAAVAVAGSPSQVNLSGLPSVWASWVTGVNVYRRVDPAGAWGLVLTQGAASATAIDNLAAPGAANASPMAALQGMCAINFQGVTRGRIDDLYIHDCVQSCIQFNSAGANPVSNDCQVSRVRMRRAGNDNLLIFNGAHDITVAECISSETTSLYNTGTPQCCGFEVGDGCFNITFEGCISHDNWNDGFLSDNHAGTAGSYAVTHSSCVAYNNGQAGAGLGSGFHLLNQDTTGKTLPRGHVYTACDSYANTADGYRSEGVPSQILSAPNVLSSCTARSNTQSGFKLIDTTDLALQGCTADGNSTYGFNLTTGTTRNRLTGCKAKGNTSGGFLTNTGCDDNTFSGCEAYSNTGAGIDGFEIHGSRNLLEGCKSHANGRGFDFVEGSGQLMSGCLAYANTADGIFIRNAANCKVRVTGCVSTGNTTWGLRTASSADGITVTATDVSGNTSGAMSLGAVVNANKIRGCDGYNPQGNSVSQPAVPASTTAQTNLTGCDCMVLVTGGTVSAIAIGGVSTGQTSGWFRVSAGQTITLTYTVAPTWTWWGD